MKKCICVLFFCLFLTGCGDEAVWETLADVLGDPVSREPCHIQMELPEEALQTAISSEEGTVYLCDGYTVTTEIYPAGDLDATLRSVTGRSRDDLEILETEKGRKYECVWTAAGEDGVQVGRTLILSDGCFHYCVSAEASEAVSGALTEVWQALFSSVCLGET